MKLIIIPSNGKLSINGEAHQVGEAPMLVEFDGPLVVSEAAAAEGVGIVRRRADGLLLGRDSMLLVYGSPADVQDVAERGHELTVRVTS